MSCRSMWTTCTRRYRLCRQPLLDPSCIATALRRPFPSSLPPSPRAAPELSRITRSRAARRQPAFAQSQQAPVRLGLPPSTRLRLPRASPVPGFQDARRSGRSPELGWLGREDAVGDGQAGWESSAREAEVARMLD
jgi:hypothetical protein